MSIGQLLDCGKRLSLRLHQLGIERTGEEIANAVYADANLDLNRSLWICEGLLDDELRIQYLINITAPVFKGENDEP